MKDSILRRIQVTASFALILSVPAVAAASQPTFAADTGRLRVSYADLDLNNDAGVAVLYARLKQASEQACGTGSLREKGSLKAAHAAQACYDDVLTSLVGKVDNKRLTAIHKS